MNTNTVNANASAAAVIGASVRVTLVGGQEYSGLVFAYERVAGLLVLQSEASKGHSFHVLKIAAISAVAPLDAPPPAAAAPAPAWGKGRPTAAQIVAGTKPNTNPRLSELVPVSQVNLKQIMHRERSAMHSHKENLKKIGVNVSKRAQDIFTALDKTLPTKWKGDAIIVLDEVMIMAPYSVDDVRGITPTSGMIVDRVQKVLAGLLKTKELVK
ncbi:protein with role in RNA processing [Podochytrium sp. JEL0797]|nr:protein with role in RNA processing [Podochytrium sp. JEL0797]